MCLLCPPWRSSPGSVAVLSSTGQLLQEVECPAPEVSGVVVHGCVAPEHVPPIDHLALSPARPASVSHQRWKHAFHKGVLSLFIMVGVLRSRCAFRVRSNTVYVSEASSNRVFTMPAVGSA
eukprot:COSAG01_NODE_565_length_15436_cov_64.116581_17_plen_121_part_00